MRDMERFFGTMELTSGAPLEPNPARYYRYIICIDNVDVGGRPQVFPTRWSKRVRAVRFGALPILRKYRHTRMMWMIRTLWRRWDID